MRRFRLGTIPLLVAALACGGSSGGNGPSAPDDPPPPPGPRPIIGTFTGTHSFTFGGIDIGTCTGSVTIDQEASGAFTGTLTVDNAELCADFGDTGTISGSVTGSQVQFDLDGFGIDELLATVGCQPLGAEAPFVGQLDGDRLIVMLSQQFDCPDQGVVGTATWSIDATRG